MSIGFGLEKLGYFTLRRPLIVGLAVLAFTALCIAQFPNVHVDGDLVRIYRNSGEQYDRYLKLKQTFGTFENDAYLLIDAPDLTDPDVLEKLRGLSFDLQLSSYAAGTLSPFSLRKPAPNGQSVPAVPENLQTSGDIAAALKTLRANDPIARNLISADLKSMVMIMFPDQELTRHGTGEGDMLAELQRSGVQL